MFEHNLWNRKLFNKGPRNVHTFLSRKAQNFGKQNTLEFVFGVDLIFKLYRHAVRHYEENLDLSFSKIQKF